METSTILIGFASGTAILALFIIFLGCDVSNPEFDSSGNIVDSIRKQCEDYSKSPSPGSFTSPFEKCVKKKTDREWMCANWFWWLRS